MARVLNMLQRFGLLRVGDDEAAVAPPSLAHPPAAAGLAPPAAATPPTVAKPVVLPAAERRFAELEGAAAASEELAFDEIYAKAGITEPAHGFTVYKLIELLEAEELHRLDPKTRAGVISGMLRRLPGGPVAVDDIVRDAAQRDQALDAFETFFADRVGRAEQESEERNRALQEEIDRVTRANQEAMEVNRAKVAAERERLERWRVRKRQEERRLFDAVAPFVAANPVDVEEPGPEPDPPAAADS